MQVEQQHRPSATAWDIADILHSELFTAPAPPNPNPSPSTSSFSSPSSRESTPMSHHLPTPPQQPPYPSFAASSATASNPMDLSSESFFSFLDDGGKAATQQQSPDPFSTSGSNPFDYNFGFDFASMPMMMTSPMPAGGPQSASEYGMDMNAFMSGLGVDATMEMGIDPQLVDSPAPLVSMGEDDDAEDEVEQEEQDVDDAPIINTRSSNKKRDAPTESIASTRTKRGRKPTISTNTQSRASSSSPTSTSPTSTHQDTQQSDKLTLTIAPVKVGGRGSARRGTVQSGGITKKSTTPVTGANGPIYSGSLLKVVKEDAGKENNVNAAPASKGRGRGRRGTTAAAAPAALPSPPSSHHDGEDVEEETLSGHQSNASISSTMALTSPTSANAPGGTILTGNALVAHGRKVTPFDLGIDGLSISASFAIPPGTFNVTTPSAVGSSSGLGVPALVAANAAASGTSGTSPTSTNGPSRYTTPALNFADGVASASSGSGLHSHRVKEREQSVDPDGDDIPADWRPSAEMLAKMTSKEKRQLRNKISARNFRVRRKEYISTLELDIAERDRLLDAIRTELGTSRNENSALRQEIAALKKNLLDGRGVGGVQNELGQGRSYNLPPPAPLPEKSAAEVLMMQQQQQAAASAANLLKPNTQKDMHGNGQSAFWGGSSSPGGAGLGGGFVPVHTAFVPSVASGFASMGGPYGVVGVGVGAGAGAGTQKKPALQENMNPLMRVREKVQRGEEKSEETRETERDAERKDVVKDAFEGFADLNMFTMKSMDAYRMHLWGKMAAQYHWHQKQQHAAMQHQSPSQQQQQPNFFQQQQQQQQQNQPNFFQQQQQQQAHVSGLAAGLRPSYFTGVSSAVLSGKERSAASVLGNVTNTHAHGSAPKQEVYTPLLAALLHGKPPSSSSKSDSSSLSSTSGGDMDKVKKQAQFQADVERRQQQMQQEQARAAVIAAVASQTMFKKLGQAFWDAFSGGSVSQQKEWDAEKVRRVLEGRAVVRVVDVDVPDVKPIQQVQQQIREKKDVREKRNVSGGGSLSMPSSPLMKATEGKCGGGGNICDALEERMRSLALGPRGGKD